MLVPLNPPQGTVANTGRRGLIFKSRFHQIMKTRKEATPRKASLPARLLIIQKLEEMLSSPVATCALQSLHLLPRADEVDQKIFEGLEATLTRSLTAVVKTRVIKCYEKVGHPRLRYNHTSPH